MSRCDILHRAATDYLAAGLCVLPARRAEKRPAVGRWKQYRKRLPTEAELSAWFANRPGRSGKGPDAICIVCGRVSGNGEMIDFDAGGELFDTWAARIPPDLLARLVIETTQHNGRHVYYRYEAEVCGNMKLAQRRDGEKITTLIETRGEGGLFLCAPTPGYELIQGDLRDPPVLTVAERDVLLQAAWELNEYLPPVVLGGYRPEKRIIGRTSRTVGREFAQGRLSVEQWHCRPEKPAIRRTMQLSARECGQARRCLQPSRRCAGCARTMRMGSHQGRRQRILAATG